MNIYRTRGGTWGAREETGSSTRREVCERGRGQLKLISGKKACLRGKERNPIEKKKVSELFLLL